MRNRTESLTGKRPPAASSTDGPVAAGITRRDVLALLAALGVPAPAVGQDPVKLAPKSYRVAPENDRVRVLEYRNRPGLDVCGSGLHYHPPHIAIALSDVRFSDTENGKTTTGRIGAGDVFWVEEQLHTFENLDKRASRCYLIEMKGPGWTPSTG